MRILRTLPALLLACSGVAHAATVAERSPAMPGLWWDPQRSGTGFEIHPAGTGLFVIWFTYRDDGSAVWYTAQDDSIVDGRFDGPLLRHRWQGGRHAGHVVAGRLELQIGNAERVTVHAMRDGRASDYAIEPFPMAGISPEVDHGGAWFRPEQGGYGVTVSEQGAVIAAAYYAYDAAGEPVWYFGDNQRSGNRIALNRFTARCRGCDRPDPFATPVGALVLDFDGETAMRVRVEDPTSEIAPEWRLGERSLALLTQPASQRAADRQLAAFDDDALLGAYLRDGLLNPALMPIGIDFSPAPAAGSFSQTNLQEGGVDEADAVKNDALRVYAFRTEGSQVQPLIRSVYVRDEGASIAMQPTLALTDANTLGPQDLGVMFLTGDRLVAIVGNAPGYYPSMGLVPGPYEYRNGTTRVEIFDLSQVTHPRSLWRAQFDAYYVTSRRIGDSLYLVLRSTSSVPGVQAYGTAAEIEAARARLAATPVADMLPGVRVNGAPRERLLAAGDVYLPPMGSRRPTPEFVSVVRIPLGTPALADALAVAGTVDAHYVSPTHMYLATSRHEYVVEPLSGRYSPGFISTDLHRIDLDRPTLVAGASGRVEGVLNRYSDRAAFRFSEQDNRLRVVTGAYNTWGELGQNRLTILEPSANAPAVLRTVAYLPNAQRPQPIGKRDELLYDTRFVGDRLYAVTFLKTDPLYVIDLAAPTDPKIAGALEVPGFSDYLHPLSGNLLLGVGKGASPAIQRGDGQFAWFQGVQVSLFDVSNVAHPQEMDRMTLGKRGSDTTLLRQHHAFSIVTPAGGGIEFAIPMRLHEPDGSEPPNAPPEYTYPWSRSGLFRFTVLPTGVADARLATREPLVTYRRQLSPQPPAPDEAAYGDARSVLYPRGVVYVEGGRFWHLDTSAAGATHTGPM